MLFSFVRLSSWFAIGSVTRLLSRRRYDSLPPDGKSRTPVGDIVNFVAIDSPIVSEFTGTLAVTTPLMSEF
jgi:hypothetical protein